MTTPKRYARIATPIAGAAALTLMVLANPAVADTAAAPSRSASTAICDYAPAMLQADQSLIDQRYESDPYLQQRLGVPVGDEVNDNGVYYRDYERGQLYWTEATGVREMEGDILTKYLNQGRYEVLGAPITDECSTADGVGRYNHLTGTDATGEASIYWHPDFGAHLISGSIHEHWEATGWETGTYGYPTTDTADTEGGQYNHFTGADGFGASIFWSQDSGTHGVKGAIRTHWIEQGATDSYLGYPTSDEFDISNGKRSNFQSGYITWNANTGEVQAFPS